MKIISRKIGSNRGNSRIWVEGKSLTEYGWVKGTQYIKQVYVERVGAPFPEACIILGKSFQGKFKVAGGKDRPVIDLNGKYVTASFKGCEKVTVVITEASITISGDLS